MASRLDTIIGWTLSILVHVAIAAVLVFTVRVTAPPAQAPQVKTIQATVIDQAEIDAAREAREAELRRKREAEERRRREAEAERRRQEELERQRREEAERQRQAELEAKRRAEAEAQRKAEEEARRKAEEEARRKAEAEARRKAEEEARRKAEEEARRKAEAEARAQREAELEAAMQAEQQRLEAIRAGKLAEYQALLTQKVMRNWVPPVNLGDEFYCELEVRQIPGGEVAAVTVKRCDNDILARSAETAAWKASPLPPPPDRSLFDPIIRVVFSPDTTDK